MDMMRFTILALSTKKRYSSFLKTVCSFQKIYFRVKGLKAPVSQASISINSYIEFEKGTVFPCEYR